jgi:hypothetical protein
MEEVTEIWTKLKYKKLQNLYSLTNLVTTTILCRIPVLQIKKLLSLSVLVNYVRVSHSPRILTISEDILVFPRSILSLSEDNPSFLPHPSNDSTAVAILMASYEESNHEICWPGIEPTHVAEKLPIFQGLPLQNEYLFFFIRYPLQRVVWKKEERTRGGQMNFGDYV